MAIFKTYCNPRFSPQAWIVIFPFCYFIAALYATSTYASSWSSSVALVAASLSIVFIFPKPVTRLVFNLQRNTPPLSLSPPHTPHPDLQSRPSNDTHVHAVSSPNQLHPCHPADRVVISISLTHIPPPTTSSSVHNIFIHHIQISVLVQQIFFFPFFSRSLGHCCEVAAIQLIHKNPRCSICA